ncbi:adenosine deaminase [Pseudomonas putida]|nr:adenosine deaminase [Pseudomonas putida]
MASLVEKAAGAPKAELHVHIEGTLEPELIFQLAQRNEVQLPWASIQTLRQAYSFSSLQSFLDIYHVATRVLVTERDFADLARAYVERAQADNVIHAEIFFDPQTHMERGVALETVVAGLEQGLKEGDEFGFSSRLIMCFLRHLPESKALETLEQALPLFSHYPHRLIGVGLDSTEIGIPPRTFERVFAAARRAGIEVVAHAGEEGPAEYVWDALDALKVSRVDHGVASSEDDDLVDRLVREQIPLTVCPLSNLRLKIVEDMKQHPIRSLLERGVKVMVNSDDPAYFGGYVNDNYAAIINSLNLSGPQVFQLLSNSLEACFMPAEWKRNALSALTNYWHDT